MVSHCDTSIKKTYNINIYLLRCSPVRSGLHADEPQLKQDGRPGQVNFLSGLLKSPARRKNIWTINMNMTDCNMNN